MREDPKGAALLKAAASLMREDILKALPAEKRHSALMIVNAMSIAMRQLEHGDAPEQGELRALRQLLDSSDTDCASPLRNLLTALNGELARRIRVGEADPGQALRSPMLAQLRESTRQRLRESNPKILPASH